MLMAFWQSGKYTTADVFPDSLPWLFVCGSAGRAAMGGKLKPHSKMKLGKICSEK